MKFGYGSYVPYKNGYRGFICIGATRVREVHPTVKAVREWLDLMGRKKLALEGGAPEFADRDAKVTYKEITKALLEHYKAGIEGVHTDRVLESYAGELKRVEEWWGDRRIAHTRIADVDAWVRHLRIKRKLRRPPSGTTSIACRRWTTHRVWSRRVGEGTGFEVDGIRSHRTFANRTLRCDSLPRTGLNA